MDIKEYTDYDDEEIINLYHSVGWKAYTDQPDSLKRGFSNSLLVLGAYEDDKLLGLVRVVGDGETIVFVQDILVFPEYQRKGIGTALLSEIMNRFDHVRQLELMTDKTTQTVDFYQSLGFREIGSIGCCGFIR